MSKVHATVIYMRIGLLQLNATIGAFDKNRARLEEAYREAVAKGAELVLAPELFLCGYPPRDLLLRDDFVQRGLDCLEELAKAIGDAPLICGYVDRNPLRPGRALRNAAAVIQNGKVLQLVVKSLLPTYDVFDEDRYFERPENRGDDLRGHLERRRFLARAALPARSGARTGRGGRDADRQHLGLALA